LAFMLPSFAAASFVMHLFQGFCQSGTLSFLATFFRSGIKFLLRNLLALFDVKFLAKCARLFNGFLNEFLSHKSPVHLAVMTDNISTMGFTHFTLEMAFVTHGMFTMRMLLFYLILFMDVHVMVWTAMMRMVMVGDMLAMMLAMMAVMLVLHDRSPCVQ
jgi:hypothetical protein